MLNQSYFFLYLYELNLFGFPFFFYIKTKCTRKIDILVEIILQLVFFFGVTNFDASLESEGKKSLEVS